MFSENKKSKQTIFLAWFTLIFGVTKLLQFSIYALLISAVIYNEDCDDPCFVECLELTLILCVFLPFVFLLIYGTIKVITMFELKPCFDVFFDT